MVTVVGVAHRGRIPLQDIGVDFQLEAVASAGTSGFGVRKTVSLKGILSESEQLRLRRASEYCPVGQLLAKGALDLEDEITYSPEHAGAQAAGPAAQLRRPPASLPTCAPGTVHARYLVDTQEYGDSGVLQQEGEVALYLACQNLTRAGRWTLLAGHSSAAWMPPPVPLAYAALAASTVTTLQPLSGRDAWPSAGFHVEIIPHGAGNRDQSQAAAAAGTISPRRVTRRIVLPSSPAASPMQAIEAALSHDPLTLSFRSGCTLLSEQIIVTSPMTTGIQANLQAASLGHPIEDRRRP